MTTTKLLTTTQTLDRDGVAGLLTALAARVRIGQVVLEGGGDTLTLDMPAQLDVDIEVTSKPKASGTKMQLDIEIECYEGPDGGPARLTIPDLD